MRYISGENFYDVQQVFLKTRGYYSDMASGTLKRSIDRFHSRNENHSIATSATPPYYVYQKT